MESVHQDRTEMEINSPPRSRQRVQSEAENVPPLPPFDMDDLRLLRQEIQELRAENRALRREVDQVRQQVPFPVPTAPASAPPQPPTRVPRRVARRMLDEEGLSLQEFLRFKTPEYHGEEGDDPQYFLEETEKVVRRLSCSDARVIELVGMKMKNNAWDWFQRHIEDQLYGGNPPTWEIF